MYRCGSEYDRLDKLAIDIYLDYGFNSFPLDVKDVCRRLGLSLVPYSEYTGEEREFLHKESPYGFFAPRTKESTPTIFYNDDLSELRSEGSIRQTIFHEIKHYVDEDQDDEDDDLAEHFGRYFPAPIPYLIVKRIHNPNEIISQFGVSATIANNIASAVRNRIAKYGDRIFDYEKPLIELLDKDYYDLFLAE